MEKPAAKEQKVYKSKVDLWLILFLSAILIPLLAWMAFQGPYWPGLVLILSIILFVGYSVSNIRYTIDGDLLRIKSGFSSFKPITVMTIRRIEETNSILSSPAASLDRLEIIYNRYDSVIISPEDKQAFIDAVRSINPDVEVKYKRKA